MIKAILLDLDNTLVDFMRLKKLSCEAAIDAMIGAGLNIKKTKALKILFQQYDIHGLEDSNILQKLLMKLNKKINHRILAHGIVAYRRVRLSFLEPYPHTHYTLLKLKSKGIKLGIVTDAPKLKAWIRLSSMKLDALFDVVVTHDDTKKLKPHKLPFKAALNKLKLKPEQCLMVGDWPDRDIKGAKAMGMKSCFAKYGNPKIKTTNADFEIKDIKELLEIVK